MTTPKLLLADDSVTIRKVVELTFAEEGVDVTTVADAQAAMEKFVELQPDIVLVDVGLSGTNGYRICEMIKQDEATNHIPVLLLVGSFEPFDQEEAERVQADGFLTKPFHSIRELVTQVFSLLRKDGEDGGRSVPSISETIAGETSDIDDLYENSFADTVHMSEFPNAPDALGDPGMDDEMIERSYPNMEKPEMPSDTEATEEAPEQVKDFDWSPESMVSEPVVAKPGFGPRLTVRDFDNFEAEATLTDDMVDAQLNGEAETPTAEAAGDDDEADPNYAATDENLADQIGGHVEALPDTHTGELQEPSSELIDLIAKRVVEKLSDNVIREIARESVPRIADKLIREALEEEKKG